MTAATSLDVAGLVGLPYVPGGTDPVADGGLDCWGLVRHVLVDRLGLAVPAYAGLAWRGTADDGPVGDAVRAAMGDPRWMPVAPGAVAPGDVVVLRWPRLPTHVGVAIDGTRMLHAHGRAIGAAVVRLDRQPVAGRIVGVVRWRPLGDGAAP